MMSFTACPECSALNRSRAERCHACGARIGATEAGPSAPAIDGLADAGIAQTYPAQLSGIPRSGALPLSPAWYEPSSLQPHPYPPYPPFPLVPVQIPVTRQTDSSAVVALIVGLASLLLCPPIGVVAVVLGISSLRRIAASDDMLGGRGLAIAGIVTGALGTISTLVLAVLWMQAPPTTP